MNLPTAIEHARRLLADCDASPSRHMPKPTIEQVEALRVLIAFALAIKPNRHAARLRDPLDHPDMSGCA